MDGSWVDPVITGVAGLVGAVVGAGATLLAMRTQQRREDDREKVAAFAAYLQAADQLFSEMLSIPTVTLNRLDRTLDTVVTRLLGRAGVYWLVRLLQRGLVGRRWHDLEDRFFAASARLWLIAPEEIQETMIKVERTIGLWGDRSEKERIETWRGLRRELRETFVAAA
jgi:hypothetical protein